MNPDLNVASEEILFRASYSRTYNFFIFIFCLLFFALVVLFRPSIPVLMFGAGVLLFGGGSAFTLWTLLTNRPAIVVTPEAILYRPHFFPPIEFKDIAEATLLPRVQHFSRGRMHTYLKERWRPVVLKVRDYKKYSARMPALLQAGLVDPDGSELVRIEIDFQGLDGDARDFYRIVSERIESRRQNPS